MTPTPTVRGVVDTYVDALAESDPTAAVQIGRPLASVVPRFAPDDLDQREAAARTARGAMAGARAAGAGEADLRAAFIESLRPGSALLRTMTVSMTSGLVAAASDVPPEPLGDEFFGAGCTP